MPKIIVMAMHHFMRRHFIGLAERVLTSMQEMDMELRNFIMLAEKDTKLPFHYYWKKAPT
jgi:hypothetical protein